MWRRIALSSIDKRPIGRCQLRDSPELFIALYWIALLPVRSQCNMNFTQHLLPWLGSLVFLTPAIAETATGFTGLQRDVVFSDYSPLANSAELLHRLLSPLNAVQVSKKLAHSAVALRNE